MLIGRDAWKYSGRTPEFFTGQEGCFCCPAPPLQAYYYYGRTLQPATCNCPGSQIPDTLTVTISSDCSCLNGVSFPIYRAVPGDTFDYSFCGTYYQNGGALAESPCVSEPVGKRHVAMPSGCATVLRFRFSFGAIGLASTISGLLEGRTVDAVFGTVRCHQQNTGGSSTSIITSCSPFVATHTTTGVVFTRSGGFFNSICACCTDPVSITYTITE